MSEIMILSDSSPSLRFDKLKGKTGFVHPYINDQSPSDVELVIRELLQNSLDAAGEKKMINVTIAVEEIKTSELPSFEEYKSAFDACKTARKKLKGLADEEQRIIDQISKLLESPTIPVMFCRDNGKGIAAENMPSLMWHGNTTKTEDEAGSFGVGHLASFKCSTLRYVVYGSKYFDKNNKHLDVCAGHTILASHPGDKNHPNSPDGYLVAELLDDYDIPASFSSEFPTALTKQISNIPRGGTGTVVAILGFNNFDISDIKKLLNKICEAAAKNFYVAIHRESMTVNVYMDNEPSHRILKSTLRDKLEEIGKELRASESGFLAGVRALSSYKTLLEGSCVDNNDAEVYIRLWDSSEYSTRVSKEVLLCRKGMWVARTDIPGCSPSDFANIRSFNALILPKPSSKLDQLVRRAEGPSHIGLKHFEKMNTNDKKEMNQILDSIARQIREFVGEEDKQEEWAPPGFALLGGEQEKKAESLPNIAPPGKRKNLDDPTPPTPPPPPDQPDEPNTAPESPHGQVLKAAVSMNPIYESSGKLRCLSVEIAVSDELILPQRTGIWVCWHTGSDASCSTWLPTDYLDIDRIILDDGNTFFPEKRKEVKLPSNKELSMKIFLREDVPLEVSGALKLHLLRRTKEESQEAEYAVS